MQMRHGDVWLESVERIDPKATPKAGRVVAWGEATGHSHALQMEDLLYEAPDGTVYIRALMDTAITHEEHGTLAIPAGTYRVAIQRAYDPYAQIAHRVVD